MIPYYRPKFSDFIPYPGRETAQKPYPSQRQIHISYNYREYPPPPPSPRAPTFVSQCSLYYQILRHFEEKSDFFLSPPSSPLLSFFCLPWSFPIRSNPWSPSLYPSNLSLTEGLAGSQLLSSKKGVAAWKNDEHHQEP